MLIKAGCPSFSLEWNLEEDRAQLSSGAAQQCIWSGSLFPVLWLSEPGGLPVAVKPMIDQAASMVDTNSAELALSLGRWGSAKMKIDLDPSSLRISRFEIRWNHEGVALVSVHWGCDLLTQGQRAGAPTLEKPFWPTWRSEGFGVAGAKTNPMQSFFRSWDFGNADIPLGSFGPAMGTPYGAAFPRPTYSASMGGRHGWLCLGVGSIPDAALTLKVRSRSACFEWLFREDLWPTENSTLRSWENPLWLCWDHSAWEAYRGYFRLFPQTAQNHSAHQKTFWGTWGDFRLKKYAILESIDRAVDEMGADLICIDDPWEAGKGSGRPHPGRFPRFADDIAYAHRRELGVGIWMPVGWLENPAVEGLTDDDLLLNRDGVPIKSNWAADPREEGTTFFCLDPSSPNARRFLHERTQRIVRDYKPSLLKIDFTYGIPGPDGCAPRDATMRGERLAWTYAHLVAAAAHEIDPTITILSYSISPLWDNVQDQCSLDDLGDAGMHEAAGHGQWSVWASLLGDRGRAVMASSGYHWSSDTDNLLNTAIIGAAGANLPSQLPDGTPLHPSRIARRKGLFKWHRKTTLWEPLWVDSSKGDLEDEPTPRNWGRLEKHGNETILTALALRKPSARALSEPLLRKLSWTGSWAVIAQGHASIFQDATVAVVPFEAGEIGLPRENPPAAVKACWSAQPESDAKWSWHEGKLHISVDDQTVAAGLIGFVVTD